jgi:hypothetical protein
VAKAFPLLHVMSESWNWDCPSGGTEEVPHPFDLLEYWLKNANKGVRELVVVGQDSAPRFVAFATILAYTVTPFTVSLAFSVAIT